MFCSVRTRPKGHKALWTFQTMGYSKGLLLHGWDRWSVFLPIPQSFTGHGARMNRSKEDTAFYNEAGMRFNQHIKAMWEPSNGIEIPHILFLSVCFYKFRIYLGWACLGLSVLFFSPNVAFFTWNLWISLQWLSYSRNSSLIKISSYYTLCTQLFPKKVSKFLNTNIQSSPFSYTCPAQKTLILSWDDLWIWPWLSESFHLCGRENGVGPFIEWRLWACFVDTVEKAGNRRMWKVMELQHSQTIKRHQDTVHVYSFHVWAGRASCVHKELVTDVPTAEIRGIAKLVIGLGLGGNAASGLHLRGLVSGCRGQLIWGKSTRIYAPLAPQCTLGLMHHS
jgi:hypothetical protein